MVAWVKAGSIACSKGWLTGLSCLVGWGGTVGLGTVGGTILVAMVGTLMGVNMLLLEIRVCMCLTAAASSGGNKLVP